MLPLTDFLLRTNLLLIILLTIYVTLAQGNFCQDNTIPFSVNVTADGSLILDCISLPQCFSTPAAGRKHKTFLNIIGESLTKNDLSFARNEIVCQRTLWSTSCNGIGGWFAGGTQFSSTKKCCYTNDLNSYKIIGQKLLCPGEMLDGGPQNINGSHLALEFIADVRKLKTGKGFKYLALKAIAVCATGSPKVAEGLKIRHEGPHAVDLQTMLSSFNETETKHSGRFNETNEEEKEESEVIKSSSKQLTGNDFAPSSNGEKIAATEQNIATTLAPLIEVHDTSNSPPNGYSSNVASTGCSSTNTPKGVFTNCFNRPSAAVRGSNTIAQSTTCFSGDGKVETENGPKLMSDLVIGDKVLSSTNKKMLTFSPIVSFLHRKPSQPALFYQLEAANGAHIKLTAKHFLYVTDCISEKYRRIYAAQAKVGQCLAWADTNEQRIKLIPIVNITYTWQTGIYSPLTASGAIVVNNIAASCHSTVSGHHNLHQSYFHWLRKYKEWIDWAYELVNMLTLSEETEIVFGGHFLSNVADLIIPDIAMVS